MGISQMVDWWSQRVSLSRRCDGTVTTHHVLCDPVPDDLVTDTTTQLPYDTTMLTLTSDPHSTPGSRPAYTPRHATDRQTDGRTTHLLITSSPFELQICNSARRRAPTHFHISAAAVKRFVRLSEMNQKFQAPLQICCKIMAREPFPTIGQISSYILFWPEHDIAARQWSH